MSANDNLETVLRYLRLVHERNKPVVDELCTDDCTWWSPGMGALSKREFCALLDEFKPIMPILPKIHVIGTTAEGERVAVEARGEGRLANGRPYENTYHFLFVFRDALIHEVKEYHGTKYALEAMSL